MNEPESPIMAKILIRFNFETEIYVRYRSEEIAPMVDYKIFRIKLLSKHFQAAVVGAFCQSNLWCQKFGVNTSQVSSLKFSFSFRSCF